MIDLLKIALEACEAKKAEQPVILDLNGLSDVTDYFLICSGKTPVQVRAITDHILDQISAAGLTAPRKEGYVEGRWVLLDCGGVIIHIMHRNEREFYALENLWREAKTLTLDSLEGL
jgi:ribosome-associated protein